VGKLEANESHLTMRFFNRVLRLDMSKQKHSYDKKLKMVMIEGLAMGFIRHTFHRDANPESYWTNTNWENKYFERDANLHGNYGDS